MIVLSGRDRRFKALYLKMFAGLKLFAMRYVDDFAAEDIAHDAFIRFYGKKMDEYTDDELQRLLYATVRNLCIDKLRHDACVLDHRVRTEAEIGLRELEDTPESEVDDEQEKLNAIANAVEKLPEKRRQIFTMYYYKGLDSKTISELLSLSQRTVENTIYRALLFIRATLGSSKD